MLLIALSRGRLAAVPPDTAAACRDRLGVCMGGQSAILMNSLQVLLHLAFNVVSATHLPKSERVCHRSCECR